LLEVLAYFGFRFREILHVFTLQPMKYCLRSLFLCGLFCLVTGQALAQKYEEIMTLSRTNMRQGFTLISADSQIQLLEEQIMLRPEFQEAYYLLAYTHAWNKPEEMDFIQFHTWENTLRISELLEKALKIDSIYEGEMIILDIQSKLFSEWSTLALKYWAKGNLDSMQICFEQAKARRGLHPSILSFYRAVLSRCPKNSFVLSSGDNTSYYFFYLQKAEGFRCDVTIADVSLLNSNWYYPKLLEEGLGHLADSSEIMDSDFWIPWTASSFEAGGKEIAIKPSEKNYLNRSERIQMDLLQYYYGSGYYIISGSDERQNMSLQEDGCYTYFMKRIDAEDCIYEPVEEEVWKTLDELTSTHIADRSCQLIIKVVVWDTLAKIFTNTENHEERITEYNRLKELITPYRCPKLYEEIKSTFEQADKFVYSE